MTDPRASREDALSALRPILQALAASSDRQKALFPELGAVGDELALEFDRRYHALVGSDYGTALPEEAQAALSAIEAAFDRMVDAHEHVWSAEGIAEHEEWATMRRQAARALQALGWPEQEPASPADGHEP